MDDYTQPLTGQATPPAAERGRKRKAEMPVPTELIRGMNPFEEKAFWAFLETLRDNIPDLTPLEEMLLPLVGVKFIQTLRVSAREMNENEILSSMKQYPEVHLRAWLSMLGVGRTTGRRQSLDSDEAATQFWKSLK